VMLSPMNTIVSLTLSRIAPSMLRSPAEFP
jgi:hypothetical protein